MKYHGAQEERENRTSQIPSVFESGELTTTNLSKAEERFGLSYSSTLVALNRGALGRSCRILLSTDITGLVVAAVVIF